MGLPLLEILNIIGTQYPDAMSILQQPGVFQVYVDYINSQAGQDGKEPWTPGQFKAALRATPYYQNTSDPVREWHKLNAIDPATARTKRDAVMRQIADLERQTGVTLDKTGGFNSPAFAFMVNAVTNGWDTQEIKYQLLASVNAKAAGGELGKTASDVRALADEYGVPLSDQSVMDYARKMGEGAIDQNGVQGYLIEQAKSLFPTLSAALDKGITVKQYMAPMLQIAQQELNINPSEISLTDGKWLKLINTTDPKTGERRPMNLDEALTMFRTDSAFGYDKTDKAAQDATQLASVLQQKLGATA